MSGLSWKLTLTDSMSGPARSASGAMSKLEGTLKGVAEADDRATASSNKLAAAMRRKAAAAAAASRGSGGSEAERKAKADARWNNKREQDVARAMARMDRKVAIQQRIQQRSRDAAAKASAQSSAAGSQKGLDIASALPGLGFLSGGVAGAVAAGVSMITSAASKLASVIAELASMAARFAWDQFLDISAIQGFKSATQFAFNNLLKSKAAGEAAYNKAVATSQRIGADLKASVSGTQALVAQGFSVDFADEIVRAMADLKALNPMANMDGIIRAVSQIKTTGRLQGDELMQLAEAGVNVEQVYKKIAAAMGLVEKKGKKGTVMEQVRKLQEDGKISSQTAIDAIMSSMKDMVGGKDFGSVAAERASGSVTGLLGQLANLKDQLYSSINIDWSPVMRGIQTLMGALKSDAAANFFSKVGGFINSVFSKLDNIDGSKIGKLFDIGSGALDQIMARLENLDGDKMGQAFDMFIEGAGAATGLMIALLDLAIALGPVWAAAGTGVIWFTRGLTRLAEQTTLAVGMVELMVGAIGAIPGALMGAGEAIWGFLTGIVDSWVDRTSHMTELASALGGDIVAGIVTGINDGASSVVDAIVNVATSAIDAAKGTLGIHSPSVVFQRIYEMTGAGAERGVERSSGGVAAASREQAAGAGAATAMMAGARTAGGALRQSVGGGASSSTSKTIDFGGVVVNSRATDAKAVAAETASLLQGMVDRSG